MAKPRVSKQLAERKAEEARARQLKKMDEEKGRLVQQIMLIKTAIRDKKDMIRNMSPEKTRALRNQVDGLEKERERKSRELGDKTFQKTQLLKELQRLHGR
jgi:hypothetical protein